MREICHLAVTTFLVDPIEFFLASFMSDNKRVLRQFIKRNEKALKEYAMQFNFNQEI